MSEQKMPVQGEVLTGRALAAYARRTHGDSFQWDKLAEEAAEVAVVAMHAKYDRATPEEVFGELADIALMIDIVCEMLGREGFDEAVRRNEDRVRRRLDAIEAKRAEDRRAYVGAITSPRTRVDVPIPAPRGARSAEDADALTVLTLSAGLDASARQKTLAEIRVESGPRWLELGTAVEWRPDSSTEVRAVVIASAVYAQDGTACVRVNDPTGRFTPVLAIPIAELYPSEPATLTWSFEMGDTVYDQHGNEAKVALRVHTTDAEPYYEFDAPKGMFNLPKSDAEKIFAKTREPRVVECVPSEYAWLTVGVEVFWSDRSRKGFVQGAPYCSSNGLWYVRVLEYGTGTVFPRCDMLCAWAPPEQPPAWITVGALCEYDYTLSLSAKPWVTVRDVEVVHVDRSSGFVHVREPATGSGWSTIAKHLRMRLPEEFAWMVPGAQAMRNYSARPQSEVTIVERPFYEVGGWWVRVLRSDGSETVPRCVNLGIAVPTQWRWLTPGIDVLWKHAESRVTKAPYFRKGHWCVAVRPIDSDVDYGVYVESVQRIEAEPEVEVDVIAIPERYAWIERGAVGEWSHTLASGLPPATEAILVLDVPTPLNASDESPLDWCVRCIGNYHRRLTVMCGVMRQHEHLRGYAHSEEDLRFIEGRPRTGPKPPEAFAWLARGVVADWHPSPAANALMRVTVADVPYALYEAWRDPTWAVPVLGVMGEPYTALCTALRHAGMHVVTEEVDRLEEVARENGFTIPQVLRAEAEAEPLGEVHAEVRFVEAPNTADVPWAYAWQTRGKRAAWYPEPRRSEDEGVAVVVIAAPQLLTNDEAAVTAAVAVNPSMPPWATLVRRESDGIYLLSGSGQLKSRGGVLTDEEMRALFTHETPKAPLPPVLTEAPRIPDKYTWMIRGHRAAWQDSRSYTRVSFDVVLAGAPYREPNRPWHVPIVSMSLNGVIEARCDDLSPRESKPFDDESELLDRLAPLPEVDAKEPCGACGDTKGECSPPGCDADPPAPSAYAWAARGKRATWLVEYPGDRVWLDVVLISGPYPLREDDGTPPHEWRVVVTAPSFVNVVTVPCGQLTERFEPLTDAESRLLARHEVSCGVDSETGKPCVVVTNHPRVDAKEESPKQPQTPTQSRATLAVPPEHAWIARGQRAQHTDTSTTPAKRHNCIATGKPYPVAVNDAPPVWLVGVLMVAPAYDGPTFVQVACESLSPRPGALGDDEMRTLVDILGLHEEPAPTPKADAALGTTEGVQGDDESRAPGRFEPAPGSREILRNEARPEAARAESMMDVEQRPLGSPESIDARPLAGPTPEGPVPPAAAPPGLVYLNAGPTPAATAVKLPDGRVVALDVDDAFGGDETVASSYSAEPCTTARHNAMVERFTKLGCSTVHCVRCGFTWSGPKRYPLGPDGVLRKVTARAEACEFTPAEIPEADTALLACTTRIAGSTPWSIEIEGSAPETFERLDGPTVDDFAPLAEDTRAKLRGEHARMSEAIENLVLWWDEASESHERARTSVHVLRLLNLGRELRLDRKG